MGDARRIVSLAPSSTRIVIGLGLQDRLVGCTRFCPPVDVRQKPEIVGGWLDVDFAKVAALKPDLVLTSTFLQEKVRDQAKALGLTVLHVDPKDLAQVLESFEEIGAALGEQGSGRKLRHALEKQLRDVRNKTVSLPRKRVYIEEWHKPPMASGNWVPELVDAAGGISGLCRPRHRSVEVTLEQVRQFDPEIIVAAWCGFCGKEDLGVIRSRPGWEKVTAIRQGKVYSLDDNYLNSPDPRLGEGVKRLAELIHGGTSNT